VQAVEIIPLEVVVRFQVAGSLALRTGLTRGTVCEPPICELYYKRDDLGDPLLNDEHVRLLGLASEAELATLRRLALQAATALRALLLRADIALYDLKFEFGRSGDALLLADEISPDTCRFRDVTTGRVLDKDVFRLDLAELVPTYREVLTRLEGLSPELLKGAA
jgi:phosphoribosylaminoimidazole-succinocarboxamide synthase